MSDAEKMRAGGLYRAPSSPGCCRAVKTCQEALAAGEEGEALGAEGFSFSARPSDLAALRAVASEITDKGARMYDLLKVRSIMGGGGGRLPRRGRL